MIDFSWWVVMWVMTLGVAFLCGCGYSQRRMEGIESEHVASANADRDWWKKCYENANEQLWCLRKSMVNEAEREIEKLKGGAR